MFGKAAPTDQRAGVRPIAFVLQNGLGFGSPVTLKVRPEDLTRTEPSRVSVHQTLGRVVNGWADNFGEGLPSVTIAGTTGWRTSAASGEDGAQAFETLNRLVVHEYHEAKQAAIDSGMDPATVKLLFVDMLDGFTWNVAPMNFVLRRSKSRPLLFQYNMVLQAISTDIDNPLRILPFAGNIPAGVEALGGVIGRIAAFADKIKGWVAQAVALKDKLLAPIAATVQRFVKMSNQIFTIVRDTVMTVKNGISSAANSLIGIAADVAQVGVNIFRTVSAIASIPGHLKAALGRVAGAFNEVVCIFANSLRPRKTYEDYTGLYGASNCSSTTGGRGPSAYANMNAFSLMQMERGPVGVSSEAYASIATVNRSDPVLVPLALPELGRHVDIINNGMIVEAGGVQA